MVEMNRACGRNHPPAAVLLPNTESTANFRVGPVDVGANVTLTWHEGVAGVSCVPVQPSDATEKSEVRLSCTASVPDHWPHRPVEMVNTCVAL
jgi:hypothetical protein